MENLLKYMYIVYVPNFVIITAKKTVQLFGLYNFIAVGDKDELITFWDQKVKGTVKLPVVK